MENKRTRPQDEVPYEVIVRYIISDYRRNLQALEMLEPYTHQLEEVVQRQQKELQAAQKALEDNVQLNSDLKKAQRRIQELTQQVQQLRENEVKEVGKMRVLTKRALANRIEQLERFIASYGMEVPEPDRNVRQFLRAKQAQDADDGLTA